MDIEKEIKTLIDLAYPHLMEAVRETVKKAEREYTGDEQGERNSFLWEHTLQVAALALTLCRREGEDPKLPVIAALFHDAGKFDRGVYHREDIPEERVSARIAASVLSSQGMEQSRIEKIVAGLNALYAEKAPENRIAGILHDADFLSKSGCLGVAHFFIKSTLKGQNLYTNLSKNLSKELTYASVLVRNMKTQAGKTLAEHRVRDTEKFYRRLLEELKESGMAWFKIREEELPCPTKKGSAVKITLVVPEVCPACGTVPVPEYSFAQGIKCTELMARISCSGCPSDYKISFCLPEILNSNE